MKISDVVSGLELELEVTQNQRDRHVEDLWRRLDPQGKRELDFKDFQRGLRRIDHPLKNADDILRDIIKRVDRNGDGIIQYEEFRVFMEAAERQLRILFHSVDRDHDGRVNREELQIGLRRAGLTVPMRRLAGFFDEMDLNNDGFISFDDWCDFLLFIPTDGGESPLKAAYSLYSTDIRLTAEGDSVVSEETLESLGMRGFLLQALLGCLLKLASPDNQLPYGPPPDIRTMLFGHPAAHIHDPSAPQSLSQVPQHPRVTLAGFSPRPPATSSGAQSPSPSASMSLSIQASDSMQRQHGNQFHLDGPVTIHPDKAVMSDAMQQSLDNAFSEDFQQPLPMDSTASNKKSRLTSYLPEPGYFLAGAVAGGISRTATAPLDRLKVYLLVNTSPSASVALEAAKHGHPLSAVNKAAKPIGEAIVSLYRAGGFRTFFAGNGLNVIKIMPESAIKFGSYEAAKRTLAKLEGHSDPNQINPYSKFAAGGLAGMTAQFCVYPLDTLKFRLQSETVQGGLKGNALLIQTARKMWDSGGIRAAYRGIGAGLLGMFPYSAIEMGTFEFLKSLYSKYRARARGVHEEDARPGNVLTGAMGAFSGAFGATVVYPLNVVRTRLQSQGTALHPPTYTGIVDVARRTIQNEGVRGLYKGLTPNVLKVAPAMSITWICYENAKKILGLQ